MNIALTSQTVTMSSLELVDFINASRKEGEAELRHDSFMVKVPKVLGEGVQNFLDTYRHPQNGQQYPCYRFPKREACLMAMSYSYELQAKVYDRMTELEQGASPYKIPQTYAEALRLCADQAEELEQKTLQIEQQKPAVEFVNKYVEARSSRCLSDVAKLLGWRPQAFIAQLADDGIIFKRGGNWIASQPHIDAGRFSLKTGSAHGHAFVNTRIEPAGVEYLAKRYAKA